MEDEQSRPKTEEQKPTPAPAPAPKGEGSTPPAAQKPAGQAGSGKAGQTAQGKEKGGKLAAILIRNTTSASPEARKTLKLLGLLKKFTCVVVQNNVMNRGMLEKIKDYTTYGEVDESTTKMLEEKRGKKGREGKPRKDFHLHPPRGGFERKGIKRSHYQGGALGYRGAKINDLIKKMV